MTWVALAAVGTIRAAIIDRYICRSGGVNSKEMQETY
jgi:hypothetical protein